MKRALILVALAGCPDNALVVAPAIDVPANDSASAFPLDTIALAIAHQGSGVDIASQSFTPGQPIELPGVPFGDDLVIHMTGRVGSSEVAYGRSCTLAVSQNATVPQPHLFFSRSVKFADLDLATHPEVRLDGRGIADLDGSALVLGGNDPAIATSPISDVERFDPRTGELAVLATLQPRLGAVVATLGTSTDAKIALIGGQDPASGAGATFVELVDADGPIARRVERIDDAQMARVELTATALSDGRVIAIGGMPPNGAPADAVDEISLSNDTATVRLLRAQLAHPRRGHTATRLGDDVGAPVLVAGGVDAANLPVAAAELFKPLAEDFSKTFTANTMVVPRSHHQAVRMPDNSVLIIGGLDATGAAVPTLELFTVDAGFVAVGDLPVNAGLVDFAASVLPDGRVLLTGGRRATGGAALDTAFIARLDPIDGSVDVVATDHMSIARAGHQSTLLCDGTVFVTGGTPAAAVAERYNPPSLGRR